MNWYFGGAVIITVLFVLNALFVRSLRSKGLTPPQPRTPRFRRAMSGGEAALALLPVVGLLLGLVVRTVAPDNWFGQAMARPWAIVCTVPWTMAISSLVSVVALLLRRRRAAAPR